VAAEPEVQWATRGAILRHPLKAKRLQKPGLLPAHACAATAAVRTPWGGEHAGHAHGTTEGQTGAETDGPEAQQEGPVGPGKPEEQMGRVV
jgi:hypothetical protein